MRPRLRTLPVLLLVLAAGAVAACGGDEAPATAGTPAERAFLAAMVPHHESAAQMARLAERRAQSPAVKRLARAIVRVQPAEIAQMRRIHQRLFGAPLRPDMGGHTALGLSAEEAGMDHMDGARTLVRAAAFDRAFLREMIPHHEGATRMTDAVAGRTRDRELRALAARIATGQREEIGQMRRLLARGPAPA